MSTFVWVVLGLYGAFSLGVLVGVLVGRDVQPYPAPLDLDEPLPAVGPLLRVQPCAPFGVSPLDRPWDWSRDGECVVPLLVWETPIR